MNNKAAGLFPEAYLAVSLGAFVFQRYVLQLVGVSFCDQVAMGNDLPLQLFLLVVLIQVVRCSHAWQQVVQPVL